MRLKDKGGTEKIQPPVRAGGPALASWVALLLKRLSPALQCYQTQSSCLSGMLKISDFKHIVVYLRLWFNGWFINRVMKNLP